MTDNWVAPIAEITFDLESRIIRTFKMKGEEAQKYVDNTLESLLQSSLLERSDESSRARAEESFSSSGQNTDSDNASIDESFTVRVVDPNAIDRKFSFDIRTMSGRQGIGTITVRDVTTERLLDDVLNHLSSGALIKVGVVDAATGKAVICKPGDLRSGLLWGDPSPYDDCVSEILVDVEDEKKRDDLQKRASLGEVRTNLDANLEEKKDSCSFVFGCKGVGGALAYRRICWSYLDRPDEILALTVSDVTELYSELKKARHEAEHDQLTKLLNRHGWDRRAGKAYKDFLEGTPYSVVLFDIDNFKTINDTCGHDAGDEALQKVAKAIASIHDSKCEPYRYSGDEFVILVPGVGPEGAERLAEEIHAAAQGLSIEGDGMTLDITFSAGIAWFDRKDSPNAKPDDDAALAAAEEARNRADDQMYDAKKAKGAGNDRGHNGKVYWDRTVTGQKEALAGPEGSELV